MKGVWHGYVSPVSRRPVTEVEEMPPDDRVRRLENIQARSARRLIKLAIAALTVAGTALVATGRGLLTLGDDRGAARVTIQNIQVQVERNRVEIEHLRELVYKMRSTP